MKFINYDGRFTLLDAEGRGIDVSTASDGRLPAEPPSAYDRWEEVIAWARSFDGSGDTVIDDDLVGAPSPAPRQMIGVGINYASHAAEAGFTIPAQPMIFTKLAAANAGPYDDIAISTDRVDWEVELAVVIGRLARSVQVEAAWDHVAGVTVGQDLSERGIQMRPKGTPQFSLGKSLPKFGPTGPALVTPDEINVDDLELFCNLNGEEVQRGNTSDFIFSVPRVIEYLSWATVLYPGDVIMTGTPSGIGSGRKPPLFLAPGDVLESGIAGIGTMRHHFVADTEALSEPDPSTTAS